MVVWPGSPSITSARDASKLVFACQTWHRVRARTLASLLKCQCHGCSNCNKWRNNPTPNDVKWFRSTGNRCGGDIRKKNWENHRCPYCNGCWEAREMEQAPGFDNLELPPPPPPDDDAGAHPLYLRLRRLATKPSSRSECCGPSWWRCKGNWI